MAYISTGETKDSDTGVYVRNLETNTTLALHQAPKAKYFQLGFSDSGKNLGFIVDTDTTKIQIRPNELYLWKEGGSKAKKLVGNTSTPNGYLVSRYGKLHFSKDESKMYFGLATKPIEKDTSLVDEEIVNVEVWTYNEPRLYTVQELQLKNDSIRSFKTAIHVDNGKLVQLADSIHFNSVLGDEGNAPYALVNTSMPYELEYQWTIRKDYDHKLINTATGATKWTWKKTPSLDLSPKAKYAYGYSSIDTTWITYSIATGKKNY